MRRQTPVVDAQAQTLATTASLSSSSISVGFEAQVPVATFGGPDTAEVSYNAGALTQQQQLDLPAGPGSLTPPLTLMYNSATVSDQHNVQAPAPWVGEGWHLSLGAISWTERNVDLGCGSVCESPQWEDIWQITDPSGSSADLIPPALGVSTYYDDQNGTAITPGPVTWATSPETFARVISFTGPVALPGQAVNPPCFRAFLPTGLMEEYGCTPDSLQFYPQMNGGNAGLDYVANWLPDLITDPQGNQIHITYQTDMEAGFSDSSYPRDAVLATVEYDSPGCHDSQVACTGTAWTPLMRVSFQASPTVAHVAGSSCAADGNLRCDDPIDLTASGGEAAPTVESTFVLNDALVQVRGSGGAAWNTLRDYQFAYDQSGPTTITDPFGGLAESTAGRLDLTGLTEIGADGNTALPSHTYSYTTETQFYVDSFWAPSPATNCGPSWNSGATFGQGCNLWSQSYAGNSSYLSSVSNGQGLAQTFTWQNARNNMDGIPNGADILNPFVCNTMQSTSPCDVTDDESWSRIVLTQSSDGLVRLSQSGQGGARTSTAVTGTTSYAYHLAPVDSYWGDDFDWDVLDFYNLRFMGFDAVTVTKPDGSSEIHRYPGTLGRGVIDPNDPRTGGWCTSTTPCATSPWWNPANAEHGREIEVDSYNPDGSLVQVVKTQYQALCPPTGVSGDAESNLVSELDPLNPVAVCYVAPAQVDRTLVNGATQSTAPDVTTTYVADENGRITSTTTTSNDGGATGSPTTIVQRSAYVENESVNATATSATGSFLVDFPAFQDVEDASGNRYQCTYSSYDGQGHTLGQTPGLTLGELTRSDTYTSCGTATDGFTPAGAISTSFAYDASGNQVGVDDPDALAGDSAHLGCAAAGATFSLCTAYDGTFGALPAANTNALGQASTIAYGAPTAGNEFGLLPTSTTDANGQTTAFTHDALGRQTGSTLPGETAGLTTTGTTYTFWCSGTAAQAPCLEVDQRQRLNDTTTVTARAFYDGLGRLVETRTPAPGSQDVVQYSFYDASERLAFQSVPYFVSAYSGGPGAAAYSIPDSTKPGTTTTYDGMGRTTSTTDALSHRISTSYTTVCAPASTGDSACYQQALTIDGNGHQAGIIIDATGKITYEQSYTGNSSATYALYATTRNTYDFVGNLVRVLEPDGVSGISDQYDMAGRQTAVTDPDRGTSTFSYDASGNLIQTVNARGAAGTVFVGYDGLNRPLWHNAVNSPSGAYYTYNYDSTAGGEAGVGRLTGETFSNGSMSGSYGFTYDDRGRQVGLAMTVGSASYLAQAAYDDAGNPLTQTYPDGETVTNAYTAQGWLSGVGTTQGGVTTSLLGNAGYSGVGGAFGNITSASLGSSYQYGATGDLLGRLVDTRVTSAGTTLFDQSRNFDPAGNVATASTALPTGTDNQAFCYDEQDRLTWAGSSGTTPCTGTPVPAGTLTAAQYTQSFGYDTLGRLTAGPLGSYSYGDAAHAHAATAVGTSYTASYDAAGNMTCRASSGATTCAGSSPTGAQLGYNNEGQLVSWQGGGVTDQFLYDCQGQRVAQMVTQGGTTTTTVYVGGLEAVATSGASTTTRTYYSAGGLRIATATSGTFTYLAADTLGSTAVALSASGGATASQLFGPYGALRYSSGTMPTDYGFTGQRADAASGLDYYGARYYDPAVGQFTSADSATPGGGYDLWGLSRYAYTEGNPTSLTDPTGHVPTSLGIGDEKLLPQLDNMPGLVPGLDYSPRFVPGLESPDDLEVPRTTDLWPYPMDKSVQELDSLGIPEWSREPMPELFSPNSAPGQIQVDDPTPRPPGGTELESDSQLAMNQDPNQLNDASPPGISGAATTDANASDFSIATDFNGAGTDLNNLAAGSSNFDFGGGLNFAGSSNFDFGGGLNFGGGLDFSGFDFSGFDFSGFDFLAFLF